MEYYWGYAAANTPLPSLSLQRNRPGPARSNSTKAAPERKRSRIPGHRRTTSSDTIDSLSSRSRSSHEIPLQPDLKPPHHHHNNPTLPPDPASPGTTAASSAASSDADVLRDRIPASLRYQNKQLPATPRLDTHEAATVDKTATIATTTNTTARGGGSAISPGGPGAASAVGPQRTPASPTSNNTAPSHQSSAAVAERKLLHHAAMLPEPGALNKIGGTAFGRTDSVSSATTMSTKTMTSSDPPASADGTSSPSAPHQQSRPFVVRNGRTYLADPSLQYPLPVDLAELHRQSLRTLLLVQLFNGPICSPAFANKPPTRVLEVGCGSGFWSMMCYRWYARRGHSAMSFTGIDLAPLRSGAGTGSSASSSSSDNRPSKDMKWKFVQHDMRQMPWPFPDDEFDFVMVKDLSLTVTTNLQQDLVDEYLRVLRPGGTLEIWESDHTIRMLRPHVPEPSAQAQADDNERDGAATETGAYVMTANTPLSAPLNTFIVEYNSWIAKALEARSLSPVPCTLMGPLLLQEAEVLIGINSRRLAVPLSEVRWEREGVGGVVTKDGKTYIETKGTTRDVEQSRKPLPASQAALRQTALLTLVQFIQGLEPLLREVSGKSQDEWDGWAGKMMNDLMKENGTSWGECLEVGAWWARKRK